MDFHSMEKVWKIINIPKLWISQIFGVTQKSIQFPEHGESGFLEYAKGTGKHKHFKFMDFLNISGETKIHTIPKT